MATAKLPPIVRPLDPDFLDNILSSQKVNKIIINKIVSAISEYNTSCTLAADKLLKDLEKIKNAQSSK
jgi:hypothetical protein